MRKLPEAHALSRPQGDDQEVYLQRARRGDGSMDEFSSCRRRASAALCRIAPEHEHYLRCAGEHSRGQGNRTVMKVGWYYHRLRAMTVSELAHRVTERWKHRSDASFADALRGVELGDAAEGIIALPPRETASKPLKQSLASGAASLMRGDWKLFGWREVNVGTPPQWH